MEPYIKKRGSLTREEKVLSANCWRNSFYFLFIYFFQMHFGFNIFQGIFTNNNCNEENLGQKLLIQTTGGMGTISVN
jgi:hypothetical protein